MLKKYIVNYLFLVTCFVCFGFGATFGLFKYYSSELPPLSEVYNHRLKVGSDVYDKDGQLVYTFAYENRDYISIKDIPEHVIKTLCAVEDNRFYEHWGVDILGILRAITVGMLKRDNIAGTSTITQQLAKNLFLTPDRSFARKIKEAMLAVRLEKKFSKNEITELYFNKVYLGSGQYGLEAATQKYFGKSAKELSIAEGALLVGLLKAPEGYSPYNHPLKALWRRNIVFKRMVKEEIITSSIYKSLKYQPIELYTHENKIMGIDYFIDYVKRELLKKYSVEKIFGGGLKIYTTLDTKLQNYADSIMNVELEKVELRNDYQVKYADFPKDTTAFDTKYLQAGVFAMEPQTGYVRLLIGGRNFAHSKFNRIMQAKRQPGSSFKPFAYSAALKYGYTPATIIQDEPLEFVECDTVFWSPVNYSKRNFSYLRMREALMYSRNIYATKMCYDITPKRVVNMARDFGLTSRLTPAQSIALGSHEVSPYEHIAAYSTFANQGLRTEPIFVQKVYSLEDKLLFEAKIHKTRVLDKKNTFLMTSMLQSVIKQGTGQGALWRGYHWPGGGKTGTTSGFKDAWFVGFNKFLVTGVWVGFDDFHTLGEGQTGANVSLPVWAKIMRFATLQNQNIRDEQGNIDIDLLKFKKPTGIISKRVSKATGLLPTNKNEPTILEYFIDGTQPTIFDDQFYNFSPTCYKNNLKSKLIIDFGGKPFDWERAKKNIYKRVYPDSTSKKFYITEAIALPTPADYRDASVMKNHIYIEKENIIKPGIIKSESNMDEFIDSLLTKTYKKNFLEDDQKNNENFYEKISENFEIYKENNE